MWKKNVLIVNDEEIIENGAYGFLGESLLTCAIDEEDTEDISVCFEPCERR
jgi:hypothetical protein